MICPFCAESVNDSALVCKFCRHDLSYVKQLHAELVARERRIGELEQALAAAREAAPDSTPTRTAGAGEPPTDASPARPSAPAWRGYLQGLVAFLVPFVALVATQYVFVFWLDLHVVLLRAMMIVLPLLWGLRCRWLHTAPMLAASGIAIALGLSSVVAMLAIVAIIDGTPVLPDNRHDRIETIQVILSVTLSLGCGVLIARTLVVLRARSAQMRASYSSALGTARHEPERLGAQADVAQKVIEFMMPILSGVGAVLAGVLSLLR